MNEREEIFHRLSVSVQQLRFRDNQKEMTDEILSIKWSEPDNAKKALEKYLEWLTDPKEIEFKKEMKNYLEKAFSDNTFDFAEVIDDADVAYNEIEQGNPRNVFNAIYKYICENE